MRKNKRKLPIGFSACYTYKSSFAIQDIYVKYEDDVRAMDILLARGYEKQAVYIASQQYNIFKLKKYL